MLSPRDFLLHMCRALDESIFRDGALNLPDSDIADGIKSLTEKYRELIFGPGHNYGTYREMLEVRRRLRNIASQKTLSSGNFVEIFVLSLPRVELYQTLLWMV